MTFPHLPLAPLLAAHGLIVIAALAVAYLCFGG